MQFTFTWIISLEEILLVQFYKVKKKKSTKLRLKVLLEVIYSASS